MINQLLKNRDGDMKGINKAILADLILLYRSPGDLDFSFHLDGASEKESKKEHHPISDFLHSARNRLAVSHCLLIRAILIDDRSDVSVSSSLSKYPQPANCLRKDSVFW